MTLPASTPHAAVFTPRPDEVGQIVAEGIDAFKKWTIVGGKWVKRPAALIEAASARRLAARRAEQEKSR